MQRLNLTRTQPTETEPENVHIFRRVVLVLSLVVFLGIFACSAAFTAPVFAQGGPTQPPPGDGEPVRAPDRVEVEPTARDEAIRERLKRILVATNWFENPQVVVSEGVVFLNGRTESADYRTWAGDLARNTQDVVAVVNRIEIKEPSAWDFQPAMAVLRELGINLGRSLPLIGVSLLVLLVTWLIARFGVAVTRKYLRRRLSTPLLGNVVGYMVGIAIFLTGLYIVLQVAGLTNIALSVVGGTGLLGLVLGIAFRDITENFLASIFLSIHNPYRKNDLVEINGIRGFVQALTTRVTILMTLDGNHVQIPNAIVYKSNLYNFTSNPNSRVDFTVGIGYQDSISEAQKTALKVLENHPAVMKEPEPLVLVSDLGSSTVNLHIFFWINRSELSMVKVKSSVIRLVKSAYQAAGISMPDEARELIFPEGVPVQLIQPDRAKQSASQLTKTDEKIEPLDVESISTEAEAGLRSEAGDIQEQASHAWQPEDGEDLLKSSENDEKKKSGSMA